MLVSTESVRNGMRIVNDVLNKDGMIVVAKDTIITHNIVNRLRRYHIAQVDVTADTKIEGITSFKDSEEVAKYKKSMDVVKDSLNNSFNHILSENMEDDSEDSVRQVMDIGKKLFKENGDNKNLLDILYCMQEFSDTTYVHCINVAMIAGLLGKWLCWTEDDINLLVQCGMFHDIGKLMIPPEILHKPGKLTDEEYRMMKNHTTFGFQKLKDMKLIPSEVKRTAMLHHERCDGSGYPLGIKGSKIDKYSKVIAIADVYDALTANRVYREGMCPFDVIAILEQEGLKLYETRYILTFLQRILYSYLDKKVHLNNGMTATIAEINTDARSKPIVIMEGGKRIDLSLYDEIKIDKVVE